MSRLVDALTKLRTYLDESKLQPGERLIPERNLADILGVTRSQLRTAMRQLAAEGRVWRHVGKGTFISPDSAKAVADNITTQIRSINPRELIDARLALEPRLARLAAVSASDEDIEQMYHCIEETKAARNWQEFQHWDMMLHRKIAESARNTLLLELYCAISNPEKGAIWGKLKQRALTPERQREATREHLRFLRAIRDRDMEAAEAQMRHHLEITQQRMTASTYQPVSQLYAEDTEDDEDNEDAGA